MMTLILINSAFAFEVMANDAGVELQWQQMPVAYSWLDDHAPALPGLEAAIDGAFEAWADAPRTTIQVDRTWQDGAPVVELDDVDAVFFDRLWPASEDALALATTWTNTDGEIVAFDIHINPHVAWATDDRPDAYDLQAALTHEVGHVLGIDHSSEPEATMYASQATGEGYRRWLHEDDHDAATHLYGNGEAGPDGADALTLEDLAEAWSCSTSPSAAGVLPLLLAVAGLGRRRTSLRCDP